MAIAASQGFSISPLDDGVQATVPPIGVSRMFEPWHWAVLAILGIRIAAALQDHVAPTVDVIILIAFSGFVLYRALHGRAFSFRAPKFAPASFAADVLCGVIGGRENQSVRSR